MLNLDKLKEKLSLALSQETEESYQSWLHKTVNMTRTGQSYENGVVDIVWLPFKREFKKTEENKGLYKENKDMRTNTIENRDTASLPITAIEENGIWYTYPNEETTELLGDVCLTFGSGKTKEEAVNQMFKILRYYNDYTNLNTKNYQRFVPLIKGDWKHIGGKWFVIFGLHFFFRYGKGMQGGKYILGTKLNVSFHSKWKEYKEAKEEFTKKYKINLHN